MIESEGGGVIVGVKGIKEGIDVVFPREVGYGGRRGGGGGGRNVRDGGAAGGEGEGVFHVRLEYFGCLSEVVVDYIVGEFVGYPSECGRGGRIGEWRLLVGWW